MSWCCCLLLVSVLFFQYVLATFPPVSNPPPIPNQGVRTVDISRQFYVQDDLQINPPVLKEEGYLPPLPTDPKVDDQRWFVYENQSGQTSDFPSSTETFDRYYSNGLPAVGPVATPVPDDSYVAQPSGTLKVLPNSPANAGPSDVWVLVKGPDDQYVPQRLVQIQYPQERISQVDSTDFDPQIPLGTVKSVQSSPVKTSNRILPQVWLRQQPQVQQQKVYQDATEVVNIPVPKQSVDYSPQPVKQYVQTDVSQVQQQPFVPQQNTWSPKASDYAFPPSLPTVPKGGIINSPQQNVVVNQPVIYKGEDMLSPKQTVTANQAINYKGVDISPDQAVVVDQPINYKGVDLASQNQPIAVNQQVNYKGVDSSPPKSFFVNQPDNYKGVEIISPKQTAVVNQPVNYKGVDIAPPNQDTIISQKSNYKGIDTSPNQAIIINQPDNYRSGYISAPKQVPAVSQPQINIPLSNMFAQVRHIWIPTSAQTGKFITVPATGSIVDSGKSVSSKGAPISNPLPISVSGTWVLKQDGLLPRFEPQRIVSPQAVRKGAPLGRRMVIQFNSPNNAPFIGNSGSRVPVDIWANSKDFRTPSTATKYVAPMLPLSSKSGPVVIAQPGPIVNVSPQKTYFSTDKGSPLQPIIPPVVSPVLQTSKGKPCLNVPPKPVASPKIVPYPIYRPSIAVNRQTLPRILRINRYPYGSYYVLNPKIGPSLYAYPRPQASFLQQTKNGLVRILPAKQFNIPPKQMYYSGPRRQVALPVNQLKTISPVLPQYAFPAVQAFNRLRYAYPQAGFLRSLPATGKNVFIFPPSNKKSRPDTLKTSSSESSSSESSSSESKSAKNMSKSKSKEEIGEAKSEASPESAEASKSERETEDVEAAASEPEPESKEASEEAVPVSEASEILEAADSETNSAS